MTVWRKIMASLFFGVRAKEEDRLRRERVEDQRIKFEATRAELYPYIEAGRKEYGVLK